MKIYESLVLIDPDFAGREGDDGVGHVQSIIEKAGGEIIRIEKYTEQKLAYEIKKRKRGTYILVAFRMNPESVRELERLYQLDDHVLRDVVLDRTGLKLEQFFRTYSREERSDSRDRETAGARR